MLARQLRYRDLKDRGLFKNRVTLALWIRDQGFPPGRRSVQTRAFGMKLRSRPGWRAGRPNSSRHPN